MGSIDCRIELFREWAAFEINFSFGGRFIRLINFMIIFAICIRPSWSLRQAWQLLLTSFWLVVID